MLWPLLVLGHAVALASSRAVPQEELAPTPLALPLRPQRSMEWLEPARMDRAAPGGPDGEMLSPDVKRAAAPPELDFPVAERRGKMKISGIKKWNLKKSAKMISNGATAVLPEVLPAVIDAATAGNQEEH